VLLGRGQQVLVDLDYVRRAQAVERGGEIGDVGAFDLMGDA